MGTGLNGIKIISAKRVQIENCVFTNFTQKGKEINTTSPCAVSINNVTIHNADDAISISNDNGSVVISNSNLQGVNSNGVNLIKGEVTLKVSVISDCKVALNSVTGTTAFLTGNKISENGSAFAGAGTINSSGNNTVFGINHRE
ncbi:MAG: right-handed parallel beta-helix repeat-containing protein [Flavisolibacter sp.]